MDSNNIVTAPQMADVKSIYDFWRLTNTGSPRHFYDFITTPSMERDAFIAKCSCNVAFDGNVASVSLKVGQL